MSQFGEILIYSFVAGAATLLGVYLVLFKENWARKNSIFLISFSAGVILSVALTHLAPEAMKLNSNALLWVLASFVFFYILEHSIVIHSCRENANCEVHPFGKVALAGMGLHSLLDGVVIGVGFEVSYGLGILATLSVILHKLPDGISVISILLHSNVKRSQALIYSWLIAIATPLGAVGVFFLVRDVSASFLGILIALVAGSFLYVAATDLVPEVHKKSQFSNILLFLLGILFPFVVMRLLD